MNIGTKIKTARVEAGLTQEKSAEILGVSRQTISNWENEKSYPDIVSVIKMSDIYNVSLDKLLKEDTAVNGSNYLDYLENSTNTVKSKTKLSKIVLFSVYIFIWAVSEIIFWFFTEPSDAMGYSLMFVWIIMPVTTFTVSFITGKNGFLKRFKWLLPLLLGIMFMLVPYSTLTFSNMTAFHTFRWPDLPMFPIGAAISYAGIIAGLLTERNLKKIKNK